MEHEARKAAGDCLGATSFAFDFPGQEPANYLSHLVLSMGFFLLPSCLLPSPALDSSSLLPHISTSKHSAAHTGINTLLSHTIRARAPCNRPPSKPCSTAPHVPTPGVIVATDSCAHNVVIQIACLGDLDCMVHTPQSEGTDMAFLSWRFTARDFDLLKAARKLFRPAHQTSRFFRTNFASSKMLSVVHPTDCHAFTRDLGTQVKLGNAALDVLNNAVALLEAGTESGSTKNMEMVRNLHHEAREAVGKVGGSEDDLPTQLEADQLDRLSGRTRARSTDAFSPCISLLVCSTGPTTRATVRSGASIPRVFPGEEDFGVPVGQDADSDPEADMKRYCFNTAGAKPPDLAGNLRPWPRALHGHGHGVTEFLAAGHACSS
ncbi:hypothetical protein BGW80DRAFT_1257460 [Lactifluus volemus]|nr:hypothetical protein BGW80DRAFT_1257460 [Lactifluus volemus]